MIIDTVINRNTKVEQASTANGKSEKIKRSLAKTVSWRIVGTLDTLALSWFITGEATTAVAIASVEFISKMILYFFHERAWNKINWGK